MRRSVRAGAALLAGAVAASLSCAGDSGAGSGYAPRTVEARPLDVAALEPPGPGLAWSAALELAAPDEPEFGGFSGLWAAEDGRIVAITDRGRVWTARLRRGADGAIAGVEDSRFGRLADARGEPIGPKRMADAEALARLPDGRFAVAFEHDHRLAVYAAGEDGAPAGAATPVPPPDLAGLDDNSGIEALAALPDGRLVALVERAPRDGQAGGWISRGPPADGRAVGWDPVRLPADVPLLRPTGLAPWPGGGLLLLERMVVPPVGISARLSHVDPEGWRTRPLGWLAPPHPVDNFEAVAAVRDPGDGRVRILALSDDNFRALQRTLLLELFAEDGVADPAALGDPGVTVRLLDLEGNEVDPLADPAPVADVYLFLRSDCPISNRYAPEMTRLAEAYRDRGVRFRRVYPDPDADAGSIRKHGAEYALGMDALRDPRHTLVDRTGASVTPEAAVFLPDGTLIYRGRIDDRYVAFGKSRPEPARRDLDETLRALVAGETPAPRATPAIGCYLSDLPRAGGS